MTKTLFSRTHKPTVNTITITHPDHNVRFHQCLCKLQSYSWHGEININCSVKWHQVTVFICIIIASK